jgi:hypothetical protein
MDTTGLEPRLANVLRNYYRKTFTDPVIWSRTESIRFDGTLHLPQGVLRFTAFKKKPNYTKVVIFAPNGGRLVMAYDGTDAWQLKTIRRAIPSKAAPAPMPVEPSDQAEPHRPDPGSRISQPIPMPPAEARNFIRDATTGGHLLYPLIEGKKIELLGVAKVDGDRLYELQVTLPDGQVIRSYLDPTSFLEVRQVTVNNLSGDEEVITHSDFHKIDGVRIPFTSTLHIDGEPIHQSRLDKVETNLGVMPWMFSRPSGDYLPGASEPAAQPGDADFRPPEDSAVHPGVPSGSRQWVPAEPDIWATDSFFDIETMKF